MIFGRVREGGGFWAHFLFFQNGLVPMIATRQRSFAGSEHNKKILSQNL